MNWDVIEGDWEQYKGHVRAQWRELTNDHLESIAGERNQLLGQLQQSYGIQHGEAEMQINAFQKYLRES